MLHNNMVRAKRNKKDEFYTQLVDIEEELKNYRSQFENKVVYCNCDNPEEYVDEDGNKVHQSQFWNYFKIYFNVLNLKKLVATYYREDETVYKYEYDGKDVVKTELKGDGDFRSEESIKILKSSDIVVTNPPFSLFREFVAQLIEYDKDFLIMGNNNAITYREIFPLIKDNKMWLGYSSNKTMEFALPSHYTSYDRIDEDGVKYGKVPAISWFTNLNTYKRHEDITLFKEYKNNEDKYPKYDNYDAIDVGRVAYIPKDYEGVMGVPITFLSKYNPDQFEIVGLGNSRHNFTPNKMYKNPKKVTKKGEIVSGGAINNVLTLVADEAPKGKVHYLGDNGEIILPPYARILVRNKKVEKVEK